MSINKIIHYFRKDYFDNDISRYVMHILLSILLGVLSGSIAIFFHIILGKIGYIFQPDNFLNKFNINPYFIIFIPVIGGIIIALMSRISRKTAADRGVTGIIKSVILNNGYIPIKTTIFHFIAPIISIGSGAPLGPEGPAAKMGSGIGSFMSQFMGLNHKDMKMYTVAGAGAAISAIFNAPIAGVFFGIEVILLNDLKNQALSALIISSVVADVLSRSILGSNHIIKIPSYSPGDIGDFPAFFIMGILCGLTCMIYMWGKKKSADFFNNKFKTKNEFIKMLPVTLIFGIVIIKYYSLFGMGYDTLNNVIAGNFSVITVVILLFLKTIFLILFLNAGAYGGTYAPALSIGVMLGFSFATIVNNFFGFNLDPVTFSLIAMGGILSGMNSIPLTSIMLVFEITNDYKFILPLMFVSIISYLVTVYYNKGTIYSNKLQAMGIDITKKGEVNLLGKIMVKELMIDKFDTIDFKTPFKKLVDALLKSKNGNAIILNAKKEIAGMITLNDIRTILLTEDLDAVLIAGDIANPVPHVNKNDRVSDALQKIEEYDLECIPVMTDEKNRRISGILRHQDITQAYNRLLEEWETDQFLINYKGI